MSLRRELRSELDASPNVSLLDRIDIKRRLNSIVASVNGSRTTTAAGIVQLEALRRDIVDGRP